MNTETKIEKTNNLLKEAEDLDYSSIFKMMTKQPLNEQDKKNIEEFNRQYDEAKAMKEA